MDAVQWAEAARDAGAVVFLAVHGDRVEDGGLQAALAEVGVPHTGSPACAAKLAYDKARTARLGLLYRTRLSIGSTAAHYFANARRQAQLHKCAPVAMGQLLTS